MKFFYKFIKYKRKNTASLKWKKERADKILSWEIIYSEPCFNTIRMIKVEVEFSCEQTLLCSYILN